MLAHEQSGDGQNLRSIAVCREDDVTWMNSIAAIMGNRNREKLDL